MPERKVVMTQERYAKRHKPASKVGQQGGSAQSLHAQNRDQPMGQRSGAARCDKPADLSEQIDHVSSFPRGVMSVDNEIKRVILCADDFGMGQAIDNGIIRLAELGRLGAASCLVDGPTITVHAPALVQTGIQTGLHLNFTEALARPGLYLPLAMLIRRAYLRQLDAEVVRLQISRQLDAFEAVFGRAPHFVDGHQHIHQLPQIREALIALLAQRYPGPARPWLRCTRAAALDTTPFRYRFKAAIIQALGANKLAGLAGANGFYLNARFAGVYDFRGEESAYRVLLEGWLRHIGDGDLLMCHPAGEVDANDPLGRQRFAEFSVLSGDEMAIWLHENRIQGLAGFSGNC